MAARRNSSFPSSLISSMTPFPAELLAGSSHAPQGTQFE